MKFQIPINITIHCSVCGEKLSAVIYEPPDYDLGLCVEPCKTCGLTQRATDVCPVCAGKRRIQTKSRGLVKCASCNGTGQRKPLNDIICR